MENKIRVSHRQLAVMLAKAMPIDSDDFKNKVNEFTQVIQNLPAQAKIALQSAYIFSGKVPREEREDIFQDLALAVLKAKTKDIKLGYAIARCDWRNWWQSYMLRQHFNAHNLSLESELEDVDGNTVYLRELIVGEVEFERKICDSLDCQKVMQSLPSRVKGIIQQRLLGKAVNVKDRMYLSRYLKGNGAKIKAMLAIS